MFKVKGKMDCPVVIGAIEEGQAKKNYGLVEKVL
jgi:hypothetical protein